MTDAPQSQTVFAEAFRVAIAGLGASAGDEQIGRLWTHYGLMVEANRTMNLTRITDPVEAAVKHYADSLAVGAWAKEVGLSGGIWLDVGTGAGFPAVPLAVMHPAWHIVAIDGTGKKIDFVTRAATEMRLTTLELLHAHANHWRTNSRFDVICTRAVASVARCLPFASRLSVAGGFFVAFKTPASDGQEREEAERVARTCKMTRQASFDYELVAPDERLTRRLVIYRRDS